MSEPVKITFRHVKRSPALEHAIRSRAEKLRHLHGSAIHCDVIVEPAEGHSQVSPVCIRLLVHGARHPVAAERNGVDASGRRDAYAAVHELFDSAHRQMMTLASDPRHNTPVSSVPELAVH